MCRVESIAEKIVAVLHDVVEDSDWTLAALRREGFPSSVLAALDGVTRRSRESYEHFIARSGRNPMAKRVKLADLEDNMDVRRLEKVNPKDAKRLSKYLA